MAAPLDPGGFLVALIGALGAAGVFRHLARVLGPYFTRLQAERQEERQARRFASRNPTERLIVHLETQVTLLQKRADRQEEELGELRDRADTAHAASEALLEQHRKCERDVSDLQRLVGDQQQKIGNLERQVGI